MLSVGFKSDRGQCRSLNEDAVFVLPGHQLYIVADGVGGHNAGDLASRLAVESIADYVNSRPADPDSTLAQLKGASSKDIVETVNAKVAEFADGAPQSDDITQLVIRRK